MKNFDNDNVETICITILLLAILFLNAYMATH